MRTEEVGGGGWRIEVSESEIVRNAEGDGQVERMSRRQCRIAWSLVLIYRIFLYIETVE